MDWWMAGMLIYFFGPSILIILGILALGGKARLRGRKRPTSPLQRSPTAKSRDRAS